MVHRAKSTKFGIKNFRLFPVPNWPILRPSLPLRGERNKITTVGTISLYMPLLAIYRRLHFTPVAAKPNCNFGWDMGCSVLSPLGFCGCFASHNCFLISILSPRPVVNVPGLFGKVHADAEPAETTQIAVGIMFVRYLTHRLFGTLVPLGLHHADVLVRPHHHVNAAPTLVGSPAHLHPVCLKSRNSILR